MEYKRYEKYKDSGVEWIEEIPANWEMVKIKHVLKVKDGTHDTPKYIEKGRESIPLITSKDLKGKDIDFKEAKQITFQDYININKRSDVCYNDVIMPMIGTVGNPVIVKTHRKFSIKNVALFKTSHDSTLAKYLFYLLHSNLIKEQFKLLNRGGVQTFVSLEVLRNLVITFSDDIQSIVNFLDYKTSQINKLIKNKEELIETLKQYRQSLITETVIKGLNPNVTMKDSGIEWIGEIPENWERTKFKYITRQIIDGTHSTPTYTEEGVPFLRVTDITKNKGKQINLDEVKRISKKEHKQLIQRCKPEKGNLLVSKNGTIGIPKVIEWDYEFSIFVSLCLIKFKNNINPYFISYYFESNLLDEQIALSGKTNTITNLHLDKIKEFTIMLPRLEEQNEIVKYLDKETKKIDALVENIMNQIDIIKDYRQSLIFEAVTGKIDVR